jgi:branched-chain amino acid aminotransferase
MSNIVYLNGELIPVSQAKISVMDYGFLYGYGLFETMRAYSGKVFRMDDHLERLSLSAEIIGIRVDIPEIKYAVSETIKVNQLSEARVRVTVSIGEGEMVPNPGACSEPTVLVVAGSYHPYPEDVYKRGFRAIISSTRRNSQSGLSRLKSANYLASMLARQEARAAGVDEAICLNEKGLVAEASMSNIFSVTDGMLKTPGEDSGILPGITRNVVLELTGRLNIKVLEQDIKPEEFFQAQEVFLTNSLMEIMPLVELDGKQIESGKPGELTQRLMTGYKETVIKEVGE